MPNLGAAIWRTILNIKLLCHPRCVPELLLSHLPKFIEFYLSIQMLPSKKVGLTLAGHPVVCNLSSINLKTKYTTDITKSTLITC